jgi:WD40 repeat protein
MALSPTTSPTLTATLPPSPTPTPVPVTIQEAIQRGTFAELEVFNKGPIEYRTMGENVKNSIFSPNGRQFLAFTTRGLYVYEVESWKEIFSTSLSPGVSIMSIAAINYSKDGSILAAGDSRGVVTFWDTQTWETLHSYQLHDGAVTSLDISPDNLNFVTIENERIINLWSMEDGSLLNSQFRNRDAGPVYYSLDGEWLYIPETQQGINVWDSNKLTLVNRVTWLGKVLPDDHMRANVYWRGPQSLFITLYDLDTQETTKLEFEFEEWWAFNDPTDTMFLDEKTLMVKLENFEDYYLIDLVSHTITGLSLEALSKKSFKNPEFLRIINKENIKALGFDEWGYVRSASPDASDLILSGWNEIPSGVFDLNQKAMKKIGINEFPWGESRFLSDGTLAGVDWTRPIRNPPFSNKKQQSDFTITVLSPESQYAVKSKISLPYDLPDYIDTATISPNGKVLAVGTADGNLYLWNLETKELITTIRAHNKVVEMFGFYGAYSGLFFDEDGSRLVTWGWDRSIKVFSMEDLSEVISVHGGQPVFSPDGSHLAYISSDGSIRMVPLFGGESPKIFRGKNNPSQIAFSPDEALMFTGHRDNNTGIIQVWSITDEALLLDIPQYGYVTSLILSPDGTRLYVRTTDGVISVWGHAPEK